MDSAHGAGAELPALGLGLHGVAVALFAPWHSGRVRRGFQAVWWYFSACFLAQLCGVPVGVHEPSVLSTVCPPADRNEEFVLLTSKELHRSKISTSKARIRKEQRHLWKRGMALPGWSLASAGHQCGSGSWQHCTSYFCILRHVLTLLKNAIT